MVSKSLPGRAAAEHRGSDEAKPMAMARMLSGHCHDAVCTLCVRKGSGSAGKGVTRAFESQCDAATIHTRMQHAQSARARRRHTNHSKFHSTANSGCASMHRTRVRDRCTDHSTREQ